MPFWRKDTDEERLAKEAAAKAKADQAESIRLLETGGLPLQATRRLTEQRQSGGNFFSSTFTASEYLLAREAGYIPIGQVMGTSFMRVGYNYYNTGLGWNYTGEMTSLTMAHRDARIKAVERLRQEAQLLGADGVIGVRVKMSQFSWSAGVTEFTAIGTAIRLPDREMLAQIKNLPFTSSLSGQEFWQLYEGGYWPCGLVMGNCSYFVYGDWQTRSATFGFWASLANQELSQFSDGVVRARHTAMQRLKNEIGVEGGDGAVDMDIEYKIHRVHYESNNTNYVNMLIDFMAMGTAVKRRPDGKARIRHEPLIIMDLAKRSVREIEFDDPIEDYAHGGFVDDDALD
ncbi:MAG: YbjQ family protein [Cyanobacteria bacterium SZAS LIN-3]|nr:YbjQ family protein [Cyanobacteria bacterium SZAS LIN-3]